MDLPPTHPVDNPIAFLTGVDDAAQTRAQARWLDRTYLTVRSKDYESISTLVEADFSPWRTPMTLAGTDGLQFKPGLQTSDQPRAFVNDLSRVATLELDYVEKDAYKPLKTNMYKLQDKLMYNMTANPDNEIYDVVITGTANMTSTLKAPVFVSKGHFYQISEVVAGSVPLITSRDGTPILPDPSFDETHLGAEQITGVTVYAHESLCNNF